MAEETAPRADPGKRPRLTGLAGGEEMSLRTASGLAVGEGETESGELFRDLRAPVRAGREIDDPEIPAGREELLAHGGRRALPAHGPTSADGAATPARSSARLFRQDLCRAKVLGINFHHPRFSIAERAWVWAHNPRLSLH